MKAKFVRFMVMTFIVVSFGYSVAKADGGEPVPLPQCYPKACPVSK